MNNQEDLGPPIKVHGEAWGALPEDLYIPPDALRVWLEAFEGPLDLLLYLIRKHNIDILDIPIAEVTRQYIVFIEQMQALKLELAADYLVMAAMLAEIKSRLLLPRPQQEAESVEEDPRAELMRRLQEYASFKQAAEDLDQLPRMDRDYYAAYAEAPIVQHIAVHPDVTMDNLCLALAHVLQRAALYAHHAVKAEPLSVKERMGFILSTLQQDVFMPFGSLFKSSEGRMGVVVTFIAILELVQQSLIEFIQAQPYAPIYVKGIQQPFTERCND